MYSSIYTILLITLYLPIHIYAYVFLPGIFSDGFVLQTHATYDQRPFIYGYTETIGEIVTVVRQQPNGVNDTFQATSDENNFWIVEVDPDYFADNQNNLTFYIWSETKPTEIRTIYNAAYGDVFLCSGQSNMDENVAAVFENTTTMNGSWPNIRLFSMAKAGNDTVQRDIPTFISNGETPCSFPQWPVPGTKCNIWATATEPAIIGSFSATCFYAGLELSKQLTGNRVLGLIHASVSGTPMRQWVTNETLQKCDGIKSIGQEELVSQEARDVASKATSFMPQSFPSGNATLWNAMIAPISRYAIRAVLWNQGESDAGETFDYFSCLFQGLIEQWRRTFRIGDFAFTYVQLGAQDSSSWPTYWPFTGRLAQNSALPGFNKTQSTGMATAYDIGDMGSPYPPAHVHSRRKHEVGRRLALALQHAQYALQWPSSDVINLTATVNWRPPTLVSSTQTVNGAILTFTADGNGTMIMNNTADCWSCCVSTPDDTFQVATSITSNVWINTSYTLQNGIITLVATQPGTYTAVRYAANLWPQCALYAVDNGLPANPFLVAIGTTDEKENNVPQKVVHEEKGSKNLVFPDAWTEWHGRKIPSPSLASGAANTPPMGYNRYVSSF